MATMGCICIMKQRTPECRKINDLRDFMICKKLPPKFPIRTTLIEQHALARSQQAYPTSVSKQCWCSPQKCLCDFFVSSYEAMLLNITVRRACCLTPPWRISHYDVIVIIVKLSTRIKKIIDKEVGALQLWKTHVLPNALRFDKIQECQVATECRNLDRVFVHIHTVNRFCLIDCKAL